MLFPHILGSWPRGVYSVQCTAIYTCSARTGTEKGYLENPQQSSIRSPPRASSRTRLLPSPHANAGMKQYECGRTQPLFRERYNRGINKRWKPKGLRQY